MRAEPVLATAVPRMRWLASHLTFALLGPVVTLTAAGFVSGMVYGLAGEDVDRQLPRILGAAVVQTPAAWLHAGIALALYGLLPRLISGAWGAWGVATGVWLLGTSLQLDQRLQNLSPFTHTPKMPGGQATATPLLWLAAAATTLTITAVVGFRHRDVGRT